MSKVFQAILSGMFVTFILDFFLFLSVDLHYIKKHEIDIYYNILFADNQNFILFFALSFFLGYLIIYTSNRIALSVVGVFTILTFATLIESVGERAGEALFMRKGVHIKTDKFSYYGDIYYKGRAFVTFYDYNFKKVLKLDKNKIVSGLNE